MQAQLIKYKQDYGSLLQLQKLSYQKIWKFATLPESKELFSQHGFSLPELLKKSENIEARTQFFVKVHAYWQPWQSNELFEMAQLLGIAQDNLWQLTKIEAVSNIDIKIALCVKDENSLEQIFKGIQDQDKPTVIENPHFKALPNLLIVERLKSLLALLAKAPSEKMKWNILAFSTRIAPVFANECRYSSYTQILDQLNIRDASDNALKEVFVVILQGFVD